MRELNRATGLQGAARLVFAGPCFLEVRVHVAQERGVVVRNAQHLIGDDGASNQGVSHFESSQRRHGVNESKGCQRALLSCSLAHLM